MASICLFPTEIFLQIFSDEAVTSADLASYARTCRLFRDITPQCRIHYTFKVDHPSQSTWKLIRRLLESPEIGERFRSINVTWHRRRPRKPRTWALEWKWSHQEQKQIKSICEKYGILDDVFNAILKGWNSESLLPLLLCFTPRLESLDYGRTVLDLMFPSPTACEGIRIHEYCEGSVHYWEPRDNYDIGWQHFDSCWGSHYRNISWFYATLNSGRTLPGLSSLKHFSHRGSQKDNRWPGVYLSRVLLLPNLESASIYMCRPVDSVYYSNESSTNLEFPVGRKSSIKHLKLIGCVFDQDEYDSIARFTGCLRSFEHSDYRKQVADSFLQSNNSTLVKDRISFTWAREQSGEEDFGPDDDPAHYKWEDCIGEEEDEEEEEGERSGEQEEGDDEDDDEALTR
ncbi:hypothetical protein TWF281_001811 [Arthrobotrys megalospora]